MKSFSELRNAININESTQALVEDPPYLVTLKRLNIRLYQGNIKVALYYSDKLNKYFTIAYGKNINAEPMQSENIIERKNILDTLYNIQKNNISENITLINNSIVNVDINVANNLINLYEQLDETNKDKMLSLISNDIEDFNKIESFIRDN